jgi:PAS domain S-box-containing protein
MEAGEQGHSQVERLRPILDTALDAVVVMRADGSVADWNGAAERTFGWTREEALGRSMGDLIVPPQHREAHSNGLERFNRTGEGPVLNQRIEITALHRDGREFPVELSITVVGGAEVENLFLGFLRDISQRRMAEYRLARQAKEAELLFRIARFAAETESVEDVLKACLQAICKVAGWPVGHALVAREDGELVSAIWHAEKDEGIAALREATSHLSFKPGVGLPGTVLETGEPTWMSDTDADAAFIRKGLGYRAAFGCPIKSSGRIMAVLEFFTHDVTEPDPDLLLTVRTLGEQVGRVVERNRSMISLRELNESLEQRVQERTEELMQAQDQLRQSQKMEAIGQLTGGVAHDFNNLLTIIRSSVDLLRRENVPEERKRRYLEAISDTADRAAKLTAQLLAFARRQALKPEIFDAAEQVQLICDMVRTLVGAPIEVQLDLKCENCLIEADIAQFETALINIAVNARDAMDGAGKLSILAEVAPGIPADSRHEAAPGEHVAITVRDNGRGIPAELMGQIFEPFFTTKEIGKGTGLGLSQVYGFVRQSGGDVRVKSVEGEGTAITLYLPRAEAKPGQEQSERMPPQQSGFRRMRILLVEDHKEVGEFAVQLLTELGHEARLTEHAAEALGVLEREPEAYDMLFTDVVMPGMNGIALARIVRERWPHLRIVLTSGYSHILAEEGRHGFELLQKPYSVEALSAAIGQRR